MWNKILNLKMKTSILSILSSFKITIKTYLFNTTTLKEESNAEETFAIFANFGKFAKVWCHEIFYIREFAKVYSREKSLFPIRIPVFSLLLYFFSAKNTFTAFNFPVAAKSRNFILAKNDKSGDSRKLIP